MGCGYSTPQLQQPLDAEAAAATGGDVDHQDRSPNHNNKLLLSCLIRRRVDSIRRRRRKRVGDATAINTMELETTTTDHDLSSSKHLLLNPDDRENIIIEAVCRAIEDVLLSEEREYNNAAAALQVLNNDDHKSVSSKDMVVKRQMYVPQSPSFRVYCARVDSFDSHSSSTKFHDDNAVKDVEKTKHGRRPKSMDSGSSEEEGSTSTRSSKSKIEVGEKGEITKKAGSNWKLGSPLGNGMKNLFVMPSCYSCSPNNRDRLLSRG